MMLEPTLTKLHRMKLSGMAEALIEQNQNTQYSGLSFEERIGLLVDREMTVRDNHRLTKLLRDSEITKVPF